MEIHLANQLGVSRTPIREAIRKLELEGLVIMKYRRSAAAHQRILRACFYHLFPDRFNHGIGFYCNSFQNISQPVSDTGKASVSDRLDDDYADSGSVRYTAFL